LLDHPQIVAVRRALAAPLRRFNPNVCGGMLLLLLLMWRIHLSTTLQRDTKCRVLTSRPTSSPPIIHSTAQVFSMQNASSHYEISMFLAYLRPSFPAHKRARITRRTPARALCLSHGS
jgi:hypothetical protein